jgi:membrane-associated phospholipid phosphatase
VLTVGNLLACENLKRKGSVSLPLAFSPLRQTPLFQLSSMQDMTPRKLPLQYAVMLLLLVVVPYQGSAWAQDPRFDPPKWSADSGQHPRETAPPSTTASSTPRTNPENRSCASQSFADIGHSAGTMWRGVREAPRNAIRPANLKWELPIAASTGILIGAVDVPASRHITSTSLITNSSNASNYLLYSEFGLAGLTFLSGCVTHHEHARSAGFTALEAMGYASAETGIVKVIFRRQYPDMGDGSGHFWSNGHSFASGHSAASWAFASVIAHEYPHNRWVKWGAYSLAASVSMLRFTGKRHFPSDILIGSTIGYVTGSYLASH